VAQRSPPPEPLLPAGAIQRRVKRRSLTLRSATHFADVLRVLGQFERARQLGEDTLTRCRRVLGDDHPLTLIPAHSLAVTLQELGQYESVTGAATRGRRGGGKIGPRQQMSIKP
jgi:Tetratricopeptide repeat